MVRSELSHRGEEEGQEREEAATCGCGGRRRLQRGPGLLGWLLAGALGRALGQQQAVHGGTQILLFIQ